MSQAVRGLIFASGGGLARLVLYWGLEFRNCVTTCSRYPHRICGEPLGYTAVRYWLNALLLLCICRCRQFQVITILPLFALFLNSEIKGSASGFEWKKTFVSAYLGIMWYWVAMMKFILLLKLFQGEFSPSCVLPFPAALPWQEGSSAWKCAGGGSWLCSSIYADETCFLTKLHVINRMGMFDILPCYNNSQNYYMEVVVSAEGFCPCM